MSTPRNRHPAGQPVGGQFSETQKAASGLALDEQQSPDPESDIELLLRRSHDQHQRAEKARVASRDAALSLGAAELADNGVARVHLEPWSEGGGYYVDSAYNSAGEGMLLRRDVDSEYPVSSVDQEDVEELFYSSGVNDEDVANDNEIADFDVQAWAARGAENVATMYQALAEVDAQD